MKGVRCDVRTFKKKRSIGLNYYRQGYIYFMCANYGKLPAKVKAKLDCLVRDVGGFDEAALRMLLFDVGTSVRSVALEYNLSEGRLNVLRNEFYQKAYKEFTSR